MFLWTERIAHGHFVKKGTQKRPWKIICEMFKHSKPGNYDEFEQQKLSFGEKMCGARRDEEKEGGTRGIIA